MKKLFVETNEYNMVLLLDKSNHAFPLHEENFGKKLTYDVARQADYSNFDGCKTAEECKYAAGWDGEVIDCSKDDFFEDCIITELF